MSATSHTLDDRPLYNSRIIDTFLKLLRKRYTHVDLTELLSYAGIKPYEVTDHGHWFTQEQTDRFHERLVQLTGNPDIAREAGRYAASPETLGLVRAYLLSLAGPANGFRLINHTAALLSRSAHYVSKKLAATKVEVTVTLHEGVHEKPYQCENRMGHFEALVMLFKYKPPQITHTECMFTGGNACRYEIQWEKSPADFWTVVRNYAIPSLLTAIIPLILFKPHALPVFLPIFAAVAFFFAWISEKIANRNLASTMDNLRSSANHQLEQLSINCNNAQMVNEIGQMLSACPTIDTILEKSVLALEKRLNFDRGVILLADPEKSRLEIKGSFGLDEYQAALVGDSLFTLDVTQSSGVFANCFRKQTPRLVNDMNYIEQLFPNRNLELARKLGVQSFICCPITCENEPLGLLAVDNYLSRKPLIMSDLSLLTGIAPIIGIGIRNAMHRAREVKLAELEAVNHELESFSYSLSHDLRNPLTRISTAGQGLLHGYADKLDETGRFFITNICDGCDTMEELIDVMLELSQVGQSEICMRALDIGALVGEIMQDLVQSNPERPVKISIASNMMTTGDADILKIALANLLGNAWKYTRDNPAAHIEVGMTNKDGDNAFFVKDNGVGFDMQHAGRLFIPFQRLHKTNEFPGYGIGLATVQRVITRHGGRIWAEAEVGKGASFFFTLTEARPAGRI